MVYSRMVRNETCLTLWVTLYIQAGSNPGELFGTQNIRLSGYDCAEVNYGDLNNSFLYGIRLLPLPGDLLDSYYCHINRPGDDIDQWLNAGESLVLTQERLAGMPTLSEFTRLNTGGHQCAPRTTF